MAGKHRRGYLTVEVDLNDALYEIDDAMLIQEIQNRKLTLGRDDFSPEDDLRVAYRELQCGRSSEALFILERLLFPKWSSAKECETAFLSARVQRASN